MRARNIKPGFFLNEKLAETTFQTRLLFIGLWMIADREGRLEDRPKRIKAEIFPYDNIDVSPMLFELEQHGFIVRYTVEGAQYIFIPAFKEHQRIHSNESDSKIPEYIQDGASACTFGEPDLSPREQVLVALAIPSSESLNSESLNSESLNSEFLNNAPASDEAEKAEVKKITFGEFQSESPAASLPLNTGQEHHVMPGEVEIWQNLYPAVDVMQELRNMKGWLLANSRRRKTRQGVNAFIHSWLRKSQDQGGRGNFTAIRDGPVLQPTARTQHQKNKQDLQGLAAFVSAADKEFANGYSPENCNGIGQNGNALPAPTGQGRRVAANGIRLDSAVL